MRARPIAGFVSSVCGGRIARSADGQRTQSSAAPRRNSTRIAAAGNENAGHPCPSHGRDEQNEHEEHEERSTRTSSEERHRSGEEHIDEVDAETSL